MINATRLRRAVGQEIAADALQQRVLACETRRTHRTRRGVFESVSSNLLWAPAPRTPSTRAPSTSRLLAAPCSYFWATGTGKHVQRAPHRTQPKGARGTGVCPRPRAQPRPAPLTSIMRATMPSPRELTALGITICLQCMGRVTESHLLLTQTFLPLKTGCLQTSALCSGGGGSRHPGSAPETAPGPQVWSPVPDSASGSNAVCAGSPLGAQASEPWYMNGAAAVPEECARISSTRILGRRTAPFLTFLISNRAPHGATPRS